MTSFASASLRLLHRLLGAPDRTSPDVDGPRIVLDGLTAVAWTEARLGEAATLGARFPASASARAWRRKQIETVVNRFGARLSGVDAESPRAALAAAIGLALTGQRTTSFLSGNDALGVQDLLALAAGRHVPLVVHLVARAPTTHAAGLGGGHEAWHAAGEHGLLQLFAVDVQEAVDLALVARRVAERALVPALVGMDAAATALAGQDVILPDETRLHAFLGEPSARLAPPTDAQRLLFGDVRRQVPRWYDPERPVLLGPRAGAESAGLGAVGRGPYFDEPVAPLLTEAFEAFATETGRRYGSLVTHGLDDATIVLVAQGSMVETAMAVADAARRDRRQRVGVLGVRALRPFPGVAVARALRGAAVVAVLERLVPPAGVDGPLLREVRGAVGRAGEQAGGRAGGRAGRAPRFVNVSYGVGGLAVRAADLLTLVDRLADTRADAPAAPRVLGAEFVRDDDPYPKRQARMDALRRVRPDLADLGVRARRPPPRLTSDEATLVAFLRPAGRTQTTLAGEAAVLLHDVAGGHVRSRPALTWSRSGTTCLDWVIHARTAVHDPGDDAPIDLAVVTTPTLDGLPVPARLAAGAAVLIAVPGADVAPPLPEVWRAAVTSGGLALHRVNVPADAAEEAILGGLLAVHLARRGDRRSVEAVRAVRADALVTLAAAERERHLDAFAEAFGAVERLAPGSVAAASPAAVPTPAMVRRLTRQDETADCLAHFWDQVGVLYRAGDTEALTSDPVLTAGVVPPLTSTFRNAGAGADVLPVFDAATYDGDPRLWTTCPDGSVAPLALTPRAIVDAGITLAAEAGRPADAVRAIAPKLARSMVRLARVAASPTTAGAWLDAAFADVAETSDLPTARRETLAAALANVVAVLGPLPLVRTRALFDDAERIEAGAGALLTVVVDPDTVKSPALLLAVAGGRGLAGVPRTPEHVATARRLRDLWHRLPDTSGATIERARTHPDLGTLPALMLSRHGLLAMAGGDGAEPASGAKLALRQILALAEYHGGPRLQAHLDEIDELQHAAAERLRTVLADGLPTGDLDALAEGLHVLGRGDVDLGALATRVESAVEGARVDGARLGRLVDVARGLADLRWRLGQGPDGRGRARAGVVLAPDTVAAWAATFPDNPFAGPAAVGPEDATGAFARGLVAGQLRQILAGTRLLRWARAELQHPDEAARTAAALRPLGFDALTADERALVPPVLVVGDGLTFGGSELSQLVWLLGSGLPVKVVVLSGLGAGLRGDLGVDALGAYPDRQRGDLGLLAVLARTAFVVQTSLADPAHFADGVLRALAFDGPALVHVHAPSPEQHGFDEGRMPDQARLAVASRAFPLFVFDPDADGVFGAGLDLAGNPDPASTLAACVDGPALTPVDWAATERRFAGHLRPLADDDPSPTAIDAYLAADAADRADRTPMVTVDGTRCRVDADLVADAEERLRFWRTLQELAGVVTPFTERVRADAEREVADARRAEVETLRREYETRIAGLRVEFEREATERVAAGLLTLAGYEGERVGVAGEGDSA